MSSIPESVLTAWEERKGPTVFTTVDKAGIPNAVYVTCVRQHGNDSFVIADNYFGKTRENIKSGSRGTLLFISNAGKSFQIKGSIEYQTEGALFDEMKSWNPSRLPGIAATLLKVEQVFSGSEQLA
ncbi:MAG: pyridoxamine 5'-phosphate oxidase family protein [Opitutales bacterium]|nr:pyridoxamine 5'-phosphate oxidase family protein [Opitutales bacterium]